MEVLYQLSYSPEGEPEYQVRFLATALGHPECTEVHMNEESQLSVQKRRNTNGTTSWIARVRDEYGKQFRRRIRHFGYHESRGRPNFRIFVDERNAERRTIISVRRCLRCQ